MAGVYAVSGGPARRPPQRNGLYDMIRNDLLDYGHQLPKPSSVERLFQ